MPKLANDDAREAEAAAEADAPEPIPAGQYVGRLLDVTVSDEPGDSGFHYWTWLYEVQDEGYRGRKQRHITSLSPKAKFSIGGAFRAFGVPADTHTDELIGESVLLNVDVQPISKGSRKGQLANRVLNTEPLDPAKVSTPLNGGNPAHDEDF